jgi:hypothetical protein
VNCRREKRDREVSGDQDRTAESFSAYIYMKAEKEKMDHGF